MPPRSALVRQARGLAQLGETQFMQVINGVIDERFGALVGAATADPKLQGAMIQVLKRAAPANELQARSIVDQVRFEYIQQLKPASFSYTTTSWFASLVASSTQNL